MSTPIRSVEAVRGMQARDSGMVAAESTGASSVPVGSRFQNRGEFSAKTRPATPSPGANRRSLLYPSRDSPKRSFWPLAATRVRDSCWGS